jgi:hypothetical protein
VERVRGVPIDKKTVGRWPLRMAETQIQAVSKKKFKVPVLLTGKATAVYLLRGLLKPPSRSEYRLPNLTPGSQEEQ